MPLSAAARNAEGHGSVARYQPHCPERTLLYQIVEEYYPAFTAHLAEQGRELPAGMGWNVVVPEEVVRG